VILVRGSVVVLVQPEEGFEDQNHWVLSVPAWAIEGEVGRDGDDEDSQKD
jgi:hypothetical protein